VFSSPYLAVDALAPTVGFRYRLMRGTLQIEENGLLGLVRAHNKKTRAPTTPLEPADNGYESLQGGDLSTDSFRWGD